MQINVSPNRVVSWALATATTVLMMFVTCALRANEARFTEVEDTVESVEERVHESEIQEARRDERLKMIMEAINNINTEVSKINEKLDTRP